MTPWIPIRHGAFYFVWDSGSDPEPDSVTPATGPQGTVVIDQLNVRSGPGAEYPAVGSLRRNQKVDITGRNSGWWQIRFRHPDGEFAWVYGDSRYVAAKNVSTVPIVAADPTAKPLPGPTPSKPNPPKPDPPTTVSIAFNHSGKCIRTIDGDLRNLPVQIEQASCRPEYRFMLEPVPGAAGYHYIKVALDQGRIGCLGVPDVVKKSFGNGAVKVQHCAPTDEFMWRLEPLTGANSNWSLLKTKVDEAFCLGVENYEYYYKEPAVRSEDKRLITVNWCDNDPWQKVTLRPSD